MSQPLFTETNGEPSPNPDFAARFLDSDAVARLWRVASGEERGEAFGALDSSGLLHIPKQECFLEGEDVADHSAVGTFTQRGILDCMASVARKPAVLQTGPEDRVCFTGLEANFPSLLPKCIHIEGTESVSFRPESSDPCLGLDDAYFADIAEKWSLRAVSPASDQRDRTNALSAAAFATAARNARARSSFSDLSAFEIETRARHIGMVAGDMFMRTLSWSSILTSPQPMRAFNALVAWWATSTLMPRPFRLGLLTRCLGNPAITAVLLAADAAYPALRTAAAQRAINTSALPTDGVKYSPASSGIIPTGARVEDIVGLLNGVPVFLPPRAKATGNWELLIPLKLEETMSPRIFPGLPKLTRDSNARNVKTALVHIGDEGESEEETPEVTVVFLNSEIPLTALNPGESGEHTQVVRWLGALCSAHRI